MESAKNAQEATSGRLQITCTLDLTLTLLYLGHICNFPRNTAKFISKVPLLPEESDILVMFRKGVDAHSNAEIYQDFCV
jgi:hypothetical protein